MSPHEAIARLREVAAKATPRPPTIPILGCGMAGLLDLPAGCAKLVLSDLPSGETQAPFDVAPDLTTLWRATWHALSRDGIAVFMASSLRFAASLISSGAAEFRYDLIWSKSAATGFLNAKRRPLRAHEFILMFSRSGSATYNPQMVTGASPIHAARRTIGTVNYGAQNPGTLARAGATDRYPTSVLEFATVGTSSRDRVHPQQKPVPLLRWIIRTFTNEGDLVLDPFAGSGSTGVAAEQERREFVGWDTSPDFAEREQQPGLRAILDRLAAAVKETQ